MKRLFCCLFLLAQTLFFYGQSQPIKNVIVMIPDGTSTSLLSIARWYFSEKETNWLDDYDEALLVIPRLPLPVT